MKRNCTVAFLFVGFATFIFVVPAHAQSLDAADPLELSAEVEQVNACAFATQEQYSHGEFETIEQFQEAYYECYRGTSLEQYVEIPQYEQPKVVIPEVPEVFTDPRAQLQVQEAFDAIDQPLTLVESQRIAECFTQLNQVYDLSGPPSSEVQLAIAACYDNTAYAPIAQVYRKMATRIDCATDTLGTSRLLEIVKVGSGSDREMAIVQQCIIERSAQVATGIGAVNVIAGMGTKNSLVFFYFLLTHPFFLLFSRRKTTQWGTVRNSLNQLPVDLGITRLLKEGKVFRTKVTDKQGRYLFFAPSASYTLSVTKPQFVNQEVDVRAPQGVVNTDITIEPVVKERSAQQLWWKKLQLSGHGVFAVATTAVGVGASIIDPKPWMIALAVGNVLIYTVYRSRVLKSKPTRFGQVRDTNGKAISGAVVRLFSLPRNKLVESVLTDRHGRYGFLVGDGTYQILVEKDGYQKVQTASLSMQKGSPGWVGEDVVIGTKNL